MDHPISYDVLKSIMGHLDFYPRMTCINDWWWLRKHNVERMGELCYDVLEISSSHFSIAGDTFRKGNLREKVRDCVGRRLDRSGHFFFRSAPRQEESEKLKKKVADYFLANQNIMKFWRLEVHVPLAKGVFPEGLKWECQELEICHPTRSNEPWEHTLAPFLTDRPVETIIFVLRREDDPIFEVDLIRRARCLRIKFYENISILPAMMKLRNRRNPQKIELDHPPENADSFKIDEFLYVASYWLTSRPPIGSEFTVEGYREALVDKAMAALRSCFSAKNGAVLIPGKMLPIFCLTIPMISGDELNIFETFIGGPRIYGPDTKLHLKVMQRGSSQDFPVASSASSQNVPAVPRRNRNGNARPRRRRRNRNRD